MCINNLNVPAVYEYVSIYKINRITSPRILNHPSLKSMDVSAEKKKKKKKTKLETSRLYSNTLCPIYLDHLLDLFAAHWTQAHKVRTSHAGTKVTTLGKDCIHFLGVTNLTQIQLCVGHLPVANALAVAFAILETADISVSCRLLDVSTLSMTYIFNPITII